MVITTTAAITTAPRQYNSLAPRQYNNNGNSGGYRRPYQPRPDFDASDASENAASQGEGENRGYQRPYQPRQYNNGPSPNGYYGNEYLASITMVHLVRGGYGNGTASTTMVLVGGGYGNGPRQYNNDSRRGGYGSGTSSVVTTTITRQGGYNNDSRRGGYNQESPAQGGAFPGSRARASLRVPNASEYEMPTPRS